MVVIRLKILHTHHWDPSCAPAHPCKQAPAGYLGIPGSRDRTQIPIHTPLRTPPVQCSCFQVKPLTESRWHILLPLLAINPVHIHFFFWLKNPEQFKKAWKPVRALKNRYGLLLLSNISDILWRNGDFWEVADLTCAWAEEVLVKLPHGLTLAGNQSLFGASRFDPC